MRVVLLYSAYQTDPCATFTYGEVEDYCVTVTAPTPPIITSFTPNTVCASSNATVTITGTNFTGATAVSFGGTAAQSFTVNSATQITAVVGAGTTGTISVTAPNGTATSSGTLTVNPTNTVTAGNNSPTPCVNTLMNQIEHTSTGATGVSNYGNSTGVNGLPPGVSARWVAPNRIRISGTPTVAGTFDYIIPLTGGCGTVTATGRIVVRAISATPTITGPICAGASTVSGTGVNGSNILVLRSGTSINAGAVSWSGTTWTMPVALISAGNVLTATQTESGKCSSAASGSVTVTSCPIINTVGCPLSFTACANTASASQTFTVSGSSLSANLLVTAPTGFQISLTSGSGYTNSLSFSPPTVSTTTIYVRMAALASSPASGNVTCTSTGATQRNIAVSGVVSIPPTAPTAISSFSGTTICSGQSTTLRFSGGSDGSGANYQWFSGSCGGSFGGTGLTQVVAPTTTTTYFVRRVGNSPCNSVITTCASITINVSTPPTPPTSISSTLGTSICSGQSTTLGIVGGSNGSGATYQWYASGCGSGSVLGTGSTLAVSPSSTTTYFVRRVGTSPCNGTSTTCASVTIVVNTAPSASSYNITGNTSISCGQSTTLNVSSTNTLNVPASGNNSISAGVNTTLYDNGGAAGDYVNNSNGYTVINNSGATIITLSGTFACETSYDFIRIYNGVGTGGTLLQTYSNTAGGTINFTSTAGQTITVAFTSDGSVVGSGFAMNVNYNSTVYNWYNASTGGTLLATGPSYTTPVLNSPATYYVEAANGSCGQSPRTAVTVNVATLTPDVNITSTNNIFCGVTPSPITYTATQANGGSAPNFQWFLNGSLVQNGTSTTYVVNSPQNGDLVYCVLTSNNSCAFPVTDTSSAIVTTAFPTTPGNDECVTTIPLTIDVPTSGSTGCATASAGMPAVCSGTPDDDVWYSFTASETEHLFEVIPQGTFDGVIQVFSGTCTGLTQVGCIDFFSGPEALYLNGLTVGLPYFIRIYSTGAGAATQGGFTIEVKTKCDGLASPTVTNSSPVCVGGNVQLTNSDAPTTYSVTNNAAFAIPDLQWVFRTIVVSGTGYNANQLSSVLLNLTHTWDSDLNLYLTSPSGATIELSTGNGGSGDNYTNTLFSTSGPSITTGTAPFTGTFQPEQPFSNLTGPADGLWVFRIRDVVGGDVGNFQNITLNFAGTPTYSWTGPNSFTSSANDPIVSAVVPASAGTYTVTVNYPNGCATSGSTAVNIAADPSISAQPLSTQTVCQGAPTTTLTFTAAGGTPALTYQWYSNTVNNNSTGTIISGATASTYTPPSTTVGTRYYYCVASAAGNGCT